MHDPNPPNYKLAINVQIFLPSLNPHNKTPFFLLLPPTEQREMSDIDERKSPESYISWKFIVFPAEKSGEIVTHLMKGSLWIFIFVSIGFVFFSSFSNNQPRWIRYPVYCDNYFGDSSKLSQVEEEKTNISHIQFGIGGSVSTWKNRRHYVELWWKPNVTRGFIWLDSDSKDHPWPPYKVSEDTSRFKYTNWYGSRSAIRIARIVLESYRLGLENVRWFVMGDDDTVYFVDNLVTVLSRYDHNQMVYIGGISESVEQDLIHSYGMAYGGGGFAISVGLVRELVKVLDECIDRYAYLYGSDERIGACLNEIGVPLTKEAGFHQVDIRGDAYGLLAAHPVAPLVSLHHLDAVKPIFPNVTQLEAVKLLMSAYQKDPGQTLQQTFFHDHKLNWSISVSWGYTIQIYPYFLTAKDLGTARLTFLSWMSWSNGPFTINTRPVKADPCEEPVVYFLDRVYEVGKNETVTTYKRFVAEPEKKCDRSDYVPVLAVQTVKVSAPKLVPDYWMKAPRRQCSEITSRRKHSIKIRIRSCNSKETTVNPPTTVERI